MKKPGIVLLLSMLIATALFSTAWANPFTQKKEGAAPPRTEAVRPPQAGAEPGFLMKITMAQQKIRAKMAGWIREARTRDNPMPLVWVLGAALVYGMVHSAGPGHGKAVALSYIFGFRPGVVRGLLFGNVLALSHGMSGVLLVLAVKFIFQASVGSSLESVTRATQILSYSLIALLGLFLFARSLKKWIFPPGAQASECMTAPSLLSALAMGIIPCPGVVMAMLFCISMDLTLFGVLMGLSISLGMAATLSSVVLAGIFGKGLLVKGGVSAGAGAARMESCLESLAGLGVASMGILFLLAVL
ncbi:MAG: hypothetical protein HUN04_24670 [Desulfobacter sp.]|nr:MAG: hypothetical protein HUN04_24670 [Desulfobacter sp.]